MKRTDTLSRIPLVTHEGPTGMTAPRGFVRYAVALFACASMTLFTQRASSQAFQIQTGSCSGCSTCLNFAALSPTPLRQSGSCNNNPSCGAFPSRYLDLTSYRGLLQVVSSSSDGSGCPQTLHGTAQWNTAPLPTTPDVFFTGPAGQSSVQTRVRYVMSNVSTGDTSLRFSAGFENMWANDTILPLNVTNFQLVSPLMLVGLNAWRPHNASIQSIIINGSTCFMLHLPLNEPVFELPPGYTVNCPTLGIVDNIWHGIDAPGDWNAATGGVQCFSSLHLLHSVAGNLVVNNSQSTEIDLSGLGSVGGDLTIDDNDSVEEFDLSGLGSVGGNLSVNGNGTNPSSPLAGESSLSINLASLTMVDGDLNVSANAADTTLTLGAVSLVNGDLTLETNVYGILDLSTTAVAGNIDIKTRDADAVLIRTPGLGSTVNTAINRDDAKFAVTLPADTFNPATVLTLERVDPASLPVQIALDAESDLIRIDPMIACHLDAADATLQQNATVVVEVSLAELPVPVRSAFLNALADDRVMLASKSDGAGEVYEAFDVCPAATLPTADGCATLERLDADHNPLPPRSGDAPAFVRLTALVTHFSDFAIGFEVRPGDVVLDGVVNVADLLAVVGAWGACGDPENCPSDVAPPPSGDRVVNVADLLFVIANWG